MRLPRQLSTTRLLLRPLGDGDVHDLFATYAQDPQVTRYMTWRPHQDLDETRRYVQSCADTWASGVAAPWGVFTRATGELIGSEELRIKTSRASLGYLLARAHWGQGYATEAVATVIAWALDQPKLFRVWAVCDVDNQRSARLLQRVGMQREGILRRWIVHPNISEEPRDCYCYARTR